MQVNVLEAKNRLSQLIKSAQAGEDVVIANRGEPVARLVPISKQHQAPAPGRGNGRRIAEWLASNPLPDHARRSVEEIEAAINAERESWD